MILLTEEDFEIFRGHIWKIEKTLKTEHEIENDYFKKIKELEFCVNFFGYIPLFGYVVKKYFIQEALDEAKKKHAEIVSNIIALNLALDIYENSIRFFKEKNGCESNFEAIAERLATLGLMLLSQKIPPEIYAEVIIVGIHFSERHDKSRKLFLARMRLLKILRAKITKK